MKFLIYILTFYFLIPGSNVAQCELIIHQVKKNTDTLPDPIIANYSDSSLVRINDSTLKFTFSAKEPEYLMLFIDFKSKPKWIKRIWVDSKIKKRELVIDYARKTALVRDGIKWDSITAITGLLDRETKYELELDIVKTYIKNNPVSYLSLWYFTHSHALYIESPKYKSELFNTLSTSLKEYPLYEQTKASFYPRHYPKPGDTFKEFSLKQLNDSVFNSTLIKNKWVLLHFWSNTCAPCLKEMDDMSSFYSITDTSKINFISISLDTDVNVWKASRHTRKIKWTSVWQQDGFYGDLCLYYNLNAIPFMVLFNAKKELVTVLDGANEFEKIKAYLRHVN